MTHQLKRTERFSTFTEAVTALVEEFGMTRQVATHWMWDHSFKMGTDIKIWVTMPEKS
jgi:hypothetical protein